MAITSTVKKNLTLNNEIKIDDVIVKGQSAVIDSESGKINFSDWFNDMELYKANRVEIRKLENEFEDLAFDEQEKLNGGTK